MRRIGKEEKREERRNGEVGMEKGGRGEGEKRGEE